MQKMSKEDLGTLLDRFLFAKAMECSADDMLGNVIREIYSDGMREGCSFASTYPRAAK